MVWPRSTVTCGSLCHGKTDPEQLPDRWYPALHWMLLHNVHLPVHNTPFNHTKELNSCHDAGLVSPDKAPAGGVRMIALFLCCCVLFCLTTVVTCQRNDLCEVAISIHCSKFASPKNNKHTNLEQTLLHLPCTSGPEEKGPCIQKTHQKEPKKNKTDNCNRIEGLVVTIEAHLQRV